MSPSRSQTGSFSPLALVLASTSPRRRDLLQGHGFVFETIVTDVEEISDPSLGPVRLVEKNARLKAMPVAERHPDSVVIGADTVVAFGKTILGKPADLREAAGMLELLNGQEHTVHTGVCLIHARTQRIVEFVETTRVRFHALTLEQRVEYHRRINPLDKAGGYAAQDDDGQLIAETTGSFSNVIGLPMEALTQRLLEFAVKPA